MIKNKYFDFTGYNALVTGASGHIGRAISLGLAESGAKVYLNGRDSLKINKLKKFMKKKKLKCESAIFDITNLKDVKNFFYVNKKPFSIIVNNAYNGVSSEFQDFSKKNYLDAYNISVVSVAHLINSAKKNLILSIKKNKTASIINISSMYGSISPNPEIYKKTKFNNPPFYGSAKSALEQYSKYAAVYLAKHKIRVNVISPGPFPHNNLLKKNKKFIMRLKSKNPIGSIGLPEDLVTSVLFLSSKYSRFITGANIPVDGGWKIW